MRLTGKLSEEANGKWSMVNRMHDHVTDNVT